VTLAFSDLSDVSILLRHHRTRFDSFTAWSERCYLVWRASTQLVGRRVITRQRADAIMARE